MGACGAALEAQRLYLGGRSRRTQRAAADRAPRHEARPAAAVLKYSPPFCTVKLRPLQNDELEIRSCEPRPQLHMASCNEHLSTATVHASTAPRCLERQPQRSAMLSLSEVPYCESAVMKTRLNCHESARMSAAAATGSIGSIFDASMARGGRQQRPTAAEMCGRGSVEVDLAFSAPLASGGPPKQLLPRDLEVYLARLPTFTPPTSL